MQAYRIQNIWFRYSSTWTLKDITFTTRTGEMIGLIGPNGSGKSTLLRLIAGILQPERGEIYLRDLPLSSYKEQELAKIVAFVPQETTFLFPYTVGEIVMMGRTPHMKGFFETIKDVEIVRQAMAFTSINHLSDRPITNISGGEKQRTIIARAIAQDTEILLLDEPTISLDIGYEVEILNLIRNLQREKGLTIIMATHDLNMASIFCDHIILLKEGMIYGIGSPWETLTEKNIEDVYGCRVSVDSHPLYNKPRITLWDRK